MSIVTSDHNFSEQKSKTSRWQHWSAQLKPEMKERSEHNSDDRSTAD